jgi:hypothetical protein
MPMILLSLFYLQVKAQGGVKHAVFNAALRYKQMWMKMGWKTTEASPLCNKVFFSKTQVSTASGGQYIGCSNIFVVDCIDWT